MPAPLRAVAAERCLIDTRNPGARYEELTCGHQGARLAPLMAPGEDVTGAYATWAREPTVARRYDHTHASARRRCPECGRGAPRPAWLMSESAQITDL